MWFQVDPRLAKPMYLQVVDGIKEAIAKGLLSSGEKLPSVREMAGLMTLNPNTVAKAYRELEHDRIIAVERGRGTFVAARGRPPAYEERRVSLRSAIKDVLIDAHTLGLSEDDLYREIQEVIDEWNGGGT